MPTPDAATGRRADRQAPSRRPVSRPRTAVSDSVALADRHELNHAASGWRSDWISADVDPEFALDRRVRLELTAVPRPAAWRLEYQLTVRRDGETTWTTDPGNPRTGAQPVRREVRDPVPGLPGAELAADRRRPVVADASTTPAGRLEQPVPVQLWSPPGLSADTAAPLLLVHDGSDMAERGSLLSWATAMSRDRPIRVALLDPPHGLRDKWYAADTGLLRPPRRGRAAGADVQGADRPGDRARAPAWARWRMLALQRRHPGSISALALQSGSFFTPELDSQESGYCRFEQICAAVRLISAGPDLSTDSAPRPVPVLITCGTIEENRFNNEAMAAALRRQHHPVTVRIGARRAHHDRLAGRLVPGAWNELIAPRTADADRR